MLKVIELFSGVGSQTQALKEAGISHDVYGISEIDKYAIKVYRKLHGFSPDCGYHTDLRRTDLRQQDR